MLLRYSVHLILLMGVVVWVGCKKEGGVRPEDLTARVEGRVTDEPGYSKQWGGIAGARIEAAEIHADGTLRVLGGQAESDAQGYFVLYTESSSLPVIVRAETPALLRTLAVDGGLLADSTLRVGALTAESSLEANLFYLMFQQQLAGTADITVADVALLVNTVAALQVQDASASLADLARSIHAGIIARQRFLAQKVPLSQTAATRIRQAYRHLYRAYLARMHASAEDRVALAEHARWFEQQALDRYLAEGVRMLDVLIARHAQVEGLRMEARNLHLSNDALVGFVQQGKWLFAQAAIRFVEERFQEREGTSEPPASLREAGTQLRISLQAASTITQIHQALQAYRASLLEHLQEVAGLSGDELDQMVNVLTSESVSVLNGRLQSATTVDDVVEAYLSFADQVCVTALQLLRDRLEPQFIADMLVVAVLL